MLQGRNDLFREQKKKYDDRQTFDRGGKEKQSREMRGERRNLLLMEINYGVLIISNVTIRIISSNISPKSLDFEERMIVVLHPNTALTLCTLCTNLT